MAKHFRTDVYADADQDAPRRRAPRARRRESPTSLPYGQVASYHYTYPSARVMKDDVAEAEAPASGGLRMVGRALLLLLAWAVRLVALALFLLVVACALSLPVGRHLLTQATDAVGAWLPWSSLDVLGPDTPFGGIFRVNLALLALVAFLIDWALCRARRSLL